MVEELINTNKQLQADNQQLKADNQQLKADNQQLKADNQQLKADNQQLKEKVAVLENTISERDTQASRIRVALQNVRIQPPRILDQTVLQTLLQRVGLLPKPDGQHWTGDRNFDAALDLLYAEAGIGSVAPPCDFEFDDALRTFAAGIKPTGYRFRPNLIGTCGWIGKIMADFLRANADWTTYADMNGCRGVEVLITPVKPGSSAVVRERTAGSPQFVLSAMPGERWYWKKVAGSEAPPGTFVEGSNHLVVLRELSGPSDPTIEQFDPAEGPYHLYIVS